MLKKHYRGISADQVSELFSDTALFLSDRFFHINWMRVDQKHPQFVVITPRKLQLNAVARNRLQRRAYATIRLHFSSWTVGLRIAIVVKKAAVESSPMEFRKHLLKLLKSLTF